MEASSTAKNTFNPIRSLVEKMKSKSNPEKNLISLSLGDPTVFGNLETAKEVKEAVKSAVERGGTVNGYASSIGTEMARAAIANRYKTRFSVDYTASDIVITSGCSGALDLAISVLCGPDDTLLIPSPGFTLYKTQAGSKGIRTISYPLNPERNWEIQLDEIEEILKGEENKIKAWIINNPSNPCGSVYSEDHLKSCLKLAKKYSVAVIADEIYEDMVFSGSEYIPLARLSQSEGELSVPVLTCSGLSKRFLVPGWRFGWIAISEPLRIDMTEIRKGLFDLSTLIIGSCTLIQSALPEIFSKTPESFYSQVNAILESNAKFLTKELEKIRGLRVIRPQGTLYMLIGLDGADDELICERLMTEQSISVLPGSIFGIKGYMRIVLSAPMEILKEFVDRVKEFYSNSNKQEL